MADWRVAVFAVFYIIWWPCKQLLNLVAYILAPLWTLVGFILLPFIHIAQALNYIITFPFSGKWLDRIESLYIFLGTAGLIGCITGAILFIIFSFASSSLNIDSAIVPQPRNHGRTAAEFRAERREKRDDSSSRSQVSTPVVLKKVPGSRRQGLWSQAIIEEEDSDF